MSGESLQEHHHGVHQHHEHDHHSVATSTITADTTQSFCISQEDDGYSSSSSTGFIAYMDGFHSSFYSSTMAESGMDLNSCLNFYTSGFTLQTPMQFMMAVCLCFSLALFYEWFTSYHMSHNNAAEQKIHAQKQEQNKDSSQVESPKSSYRQNKVTRNYNPMKTMSTSSLNNQQHDYHNRKSYSSIVLYGIQQLGGYLLMLGFMTFSVEIWIASLSGLMLGHFIWHSISTSTTIVKTTTSSLRGEGEASERFSFSRLRLCFKWFWYNCIVNIIPSSLSSRISQALGMQRSSRRWLSIAFCLILTLWISHRVM